MGLSQAEIAKMIDHSLLHPTLTDRELHEGCQLAGKYLVASVCIKPYAVASAAQILSGSGVAVGTVAGFPHGNSTVQTKVYEAEQACNDGATEIDLVVNIGKVLSQQWQYVQDEIEVLNNMVKSRGAILKVIFENDFLQEQHIIKLCEICNRVSPAFIKTSTGYGFVKRENGMYSYRGATLEHLRLMRKNTTAEISLKAAGGVRSLDDLLRVRAVGVSRVGATATASILEEAGHRIENGEVLHDLETGTISTEGY